MDFLRIPEEEQLCKRSEGANIVETSQFRSARRSRLIANHLIDQDGLFDSQRAKSLLAGIMPPIFSLFDKIFILQLPQVIDLFLNDKKATLRLRQLSFPLANPFVDQLIRHTLLLKQDHILEKRDICVALLVTLMNPLRQSVGSCFATAPLILSQSEQISFLLNDLYDLMTRGFLRRVIDGVDIKVPISTKTGSGDLLKLFGHTGGSDPTLVSTLNGIPVNAKPTDTIRQVLKQTLKDEDVDFGEEHFKAHTQSPLMKSYEYTVAAFADWKIDFYKWNMYTSLGLSHEEKGGVGEAIYEMLDLKLQVTNEELQELHEEILRASDQIRMHENLLRGAYQEDQIRRYKTQIEIKAHHLRLTEDTYNQKTQESETVSQFFKFLIDQFILLLPQYFQEVYDPDMHVEEGDIYQDRPAGFRLLFKHGRHDATIWSMIYDKEQYIAFLVEFFTMIEIALISASEWEAGKDLIQSIIDTIIERIREPKFIESAMRRIVALHSDRSSQLTPRTPWSYIAGGNVEAFVKCYFNLKAVPTHRILTPKSPLELLTGSIELMKDLPYPVTSQFEKNPNKALLFVNTIHAFLFKPGFDKEFVKAWEFSGNSFTYVRDEFVNKTLEQYDKVRFTDQEINQLKKQFNIQKLAIGNDVKTIVESLSAQKKVNMSHFDEYIHALLRSKGASNPWILADSNWAADYFGFIVHPRTRNIAFWRIRSDFCRSLSQWDPLFNGSEWKIYTDSQEYIGSMPDLGSLALRL